MAILKQHSVITTNYVNRFSCIGADCEDNCCHGWAIHIDKTHYKKIKKAMSVDGKQKQMFKKNVKIFRGKGASTTDYAHFVLGQEQKCNFLNDDRLCSLQACHGAEILPEVCSVYPRKLIYSGKVFEMHAFLSCPEMARLCLLEEDAMYLVESKMDVSSHFVLNVADSFYEKYFNQIRTTIVELLNPTKLTFKQRLFFTIFFAIRTQHDFYRTVETDPGSKLQSHVEYITKDEVKEEILGLIDGLVFSFINPMEILFDILTKVERTPFIINALLQGFGVDISTQKHCFFQSQELLDIHARHEKRSTQMAVVYGKRLDQYFTNYSMNYWLGVRYTTSDDLVVHSRRLLVRVACLRFLLFCHKNMITLLEQEDISGQQDLLDKTAVEVFYKFSRMFEHNPVVVKKIEDDIVKYDYGLPVLASLIKF